MWKFQRNKITPPTEILRGIYPERSVRAQDDKHAFSDILCE
jgi:hypothetical protein